MSDRAHLRSFTWFATGVVLTTMAPLLLTSSWRVGAAPGDTDSTYVPVAPCRLFDTRSGPDNIGDRSSPLGQGDIHEQQVTGSNGNCTGIPTTATAVAMNVTIVNGTQPSNLAVYPADLAAPPKVSNLNWSSGQQATPNKVDVKLSPTGRIKLRNAFGTVDVIGDVVGYYTRTSLQELSNRVGSLESELDDVVAGMPFSVIDSQDAQVQLSTSLTPVPFASVDVAAPVDGRVVVNWSARVSGSTADQQIQCGAGDSNMTWTRPEKKDGAATGLFTSIGATRGYDVSAGDATTFTLACRVTTGTAYIQQRDINATFTPSP